MFVFHRGHFEIAIFHLDCHLEVLLLLHVTTTDGFHYFSSTSERGFNPGPSSSSSPHLQHPSMSLPICGPPKDLAIPILVLFT